ncbi:hypothetical protein ESA94_13695 [Lacibacter luteus]|uniref:DUF4304 domain-containing protein n=1 Tax=Lacibacter luteus TaxID=2508719 RepID=A0A4Q1CGB1_9BACT|nr:hypothetical protein [Lacibacter luteus]RXK59189.1 hypothetical protein ESA94_13695 [Lacibacter luteus]
MIVNKKELYETVDELMSAEGYVRKKETYYKHNDQTITIFVLGKSEFSGKYETMLGCFYKELLNEDTPYPKSHKRHLHWGPDDLADKDMVNNAFNLDHVGFNSNEREKQIEGIINDYVLPFLKGIETAEGIHNTIKKYPLLIHTTRLDLRNKLGLKEE